MSTPVPTNGISIGIREASRKYDIPHQTLSRYADRGHVVVTETPTAKGLPRMLDEASVAYAAAIYHADRGQGKNPFKNPAGVASRVAIASVQRKYG